MDVDDDNEDSFESKDLPVGSIFMKKKWSDMSYKYKYENYLSKTMKKIQQLIENDYGENSFNAWNDIRQHKVLNQEISIDNVEVFKKDCQSLIHALETTTKKSVRIQILSMLPNIYTKETIMNSIPEVTKYEIDESRKLKPGELIVKEKIFRSRISQSSIDIFLNFVTSENYLQDVAYGVNKIKLENNSRLVVPNVVRLANNASIVFEYKKMCEEENIKPLCDSTCYKILKACPASYRKCLQGLDNVMAEGLACFSKLEEVVLKLMCTDAKKKELCEKLNCCLNYIKFRFRNNLSTNSKSYDHCCNFALSDEGSSNNLKCDHSHVRDCNDCLLLDITLRDIEVEIKKFNFSDEERIELLDRHTSYKTNILEWKHHIMRSFCQDLIKTKILNNLSNLDIYIHMDWAMKFIPISFRESQEQFFGKRGISWHVSCLVYSDKKNEKRTLTFVHLFDNTSQDALAVLSIIDSIMNHITNKFGKRNLYFRSDNAGCYHSQMIIGFINLIAKRNNQNLKRYDFSEAQAVKDICDRKISPIKRAIQEFVSNGNDVLNSAQMKAAIESNPRLKSVFIEICEIRSELNLKSIFDIKGITKYNSFEFTNELVSFSKTYSVGNPEVMNLKSLISKKYQKTDLNQFTNQIRMNIIDQTDHEIEDHVLIQRGILNDIFTCNKDGCNLVFNTEKGLIDHDCMISIRMPIIDKIKLQYAKLIEDVRSNFEIKSNTHVNNISIINTEIDLHLKLGYATKHRSNNRF